MTDYSKLDALIIEKIKSGARTFSQIDGGAVYDEVTRLSAETGSDSFRYIDRRLQALRKKGVLIYTTQDKWQVVK